MDVWILRAAVGIVACVSIIAVPTNLGIQNSPLGKLMLFPNKIHFMGIIFLILLKKTYFSLPSDEQDSNDNPLDSGFIHKSLLYSFIL